MTQAPPQPMRRPPRLAYKVLNPTFKTLLRSPLHGLLSGRLMVLTFTGRKSGKRFSIPVGYVQTDDTLLIATESAWSKNLHGDVPVRVRLRGRERAGLADVIADEEVMREKYRVMLAAGPQLGQIIGIRLDANGEPNPEDVARARERGHVVVRLKLV